MEGVASARGRGLVSKGRGRRRQPSSRPRRGVATKKGRGLRREAWLGFKEPGADGGIPGSKRAAEGRGLRGRRRGLKALEQEHPGQRRGPWGRGLFGRGRGFALGGWHFEVRQRSLARRSEASPRGRGYRASGPTGGAVASQKGGASPPTLRAGPVGELRTRDPGSGPRPLPSLRLLLLRRIRPRAASMAALLSMGPPLC